MLHKKFKTKDFNIIECYVKYMHKSTFTQRRNASARKNKYQKSILKIYKQNGETPQKV